MTFESYDTVRVTKRCRELIPNKVKSACERDILKAAGVNFTIFTTQVQLGTQ